MAISTLTAEHVGMGLMVIGVVIFAGMLTIRLFSSSGDWPLLLPIAIIGVVISYVGFALVLADNSRRARSCECSCTVSPAPAAAGGGEIFQPRQIPSTRRADSCAGPVRSALDALQIGAAAIFARPNHIPRHRFQARVSATIQHVQRETGRVLRLRSYDAGVVVERKA